MSLKKSIDEVENFLKGIRVTPSTRPLRAELHEMEKLAERWYRKGFNRGHKESDKHLAKGKVPKTLKFDATRQFFTSSGCSISLKSKLP